MPFFSPARHDLVVRTLRVLARPSEDTVACLHGCPHLGWVATLFVAALTLARTPATADAAAAPPAAAAPAASSSASPEPRVLRLSDCLAIALERNRSVRVSLERLARAEARVPEAAAPSRIQARAEASVTRNDEATRITLPGAPGDPPRSVDIVPLYSRSARVVFTQPVDISGALRTSRNIADLGVLSARLEVDRTRQQAMWEVRSAFYQVLRAEAAYAVAQANMASLEEHWRQAQAFFRAGVKAQFDVLRAETQVANARQGVIAARNAVELAKAALNNTMGLDVTTPIAVQPDEEPVVTIPDYRSSLTAAFQNRPEVRQAELGIEMAQRAVALAKAGGRPTLAINLNTSATADGGAFQPRAYQWNAVAALSYPLLEGGATRARVRQAEADVEAARVTAEQVREGIALEVQQSILSMAEASERIQAATKSVEQAREALRLAKVRYQEGVSTAIEVTDAQATLTQAESNLVNARYDYLLAHARYQHAIGAPSIPAPSSAEAKTGPGSEH